MSRTALFREIGAEFANPRWSWAAVNHEKRMVYFCAWAERMTESCATILSEDWEKRRARKSPGFSDAVKKLRLVQEEGYELTVFKMVNGRKPDEDGPSVIKELDKTPIAARLQKVGKEWLAVFSTEDTQLSDILPSQFTATFPEGAKKKIVVEAAERNPAARRACLEHYGAKCAVCELEFAKVYGEIGLGFIHVHHLKPLAFVDEAYEVDPVKDMVPLCPNCHAMVHKKMPPILPEDLKALMAENK
jgi:5-methylcytosine-specific restriction protein A